jgi:hypothetical protein
LLSFPLIQGILPSLDSANTNPSFFPLSTIQKFDFAFLIRNPRCSIPSYYKCCIEPQSQSTGWYGFRPVEAGYAELRLLYDYLTRLDEDAEKPKENGSATNGVNGTHTNGAHTNGTYTNGNHTNGMLSPDIAAAGSASSAGKEPGKRICIIDADDFLNDPQGTVSAFCAAVNAPYHEDMLSFDRPGDQQRAEEAFRKFGAFHDTALKHNKIISRPKVSFTFFCPLYLRSTSCLERKKRRILVLTLSGETEQASPDRCRTR